MIRDSRAIHDLNWARKGFKNRTYVHLYTLIIPITYTASL